MPLSALALAASPLDALVPAAAASSPSGWFAISLGVFENLILAITLLVTVVTAYLIWSQARAHFEVDKVHRFIERWNEPAMSDSVASVDELLDELASAEQPAEVAAGLRVKAGPEAEAARAMHRPVYNLLQEIGATYKRGLLHDDLFDDLFASIVQRYYEGLAPYMLTMRAQLGRVSLLEDWEWLAAHTRVREARKAVPKAGRGTRVAIPHKRLLRGSRELLTDVAVFGYGSLVHPDSAARTVRGPWAPFQVARTWPANLRGYERAWNYRQEVELQDPQERAHLTFLGLSPREGRVCPGVLVPVLVDDLASLDKRERDYERVEVTDRIGYDAEFLRGRDPYKRVYTYVPRSPADDSTRAVVPASYVRLLARAKDVWGERYGAMFEGLDVLPSGIETLDRMYRFVDPEQNAAAGR
ncbi:MAG: gamma-glutamylcyclotransferase family protein [Planctomycetota bacterium]